MNLWKNLSKITALLKNTPAIVLMLDFDGTLTPIANSPDKARLPKKVKNLLISLSQKEGFYPVVISGRSLKDLRKKVNLKNIIYAGNHGLEGEILGAKYSFPISEEELTDLRNIRKQLNIITDQYKNVFIEDKKLSLGLHYRLADKQCIPAIKLLLEKILQPFIKNKSISIITGKMVFDILPTTNWNKGSFAKLAIDKIRAKTKTTPVAIFIGDDITDEDVFQEVEKGITIRVGRERKSNAKYRLAGIKEVSRFLEWVNANF